jgi:phenylalanyl-tRNA synthetase alpha chain
MDPNGNLDVNDIKSLIKEHLKNKENFDSLEFSNFNFLKHQDVVGALKGLEMAEEVKLEKLEKMQLVFLEDGQFILEKGSHNILLLKTLSQNNNTLTKSALKDILSEKVLDRAFKVAMKLKQISYDKATDSISLQAKTFEDDTQLELKNYSAGKITKDDEKKIANYKKDKVLSEENVVYWRVTRGVNFGLETKMEKDLTIDMLKTGWENIKFKPYNYNAKGKEQNQGALHPVLKVRTEYRQMLIELGFQEMPTNCYVMPSFWNFDSLFQPQQHPSRDSHDTFFLTCPKYCKLDKKYDEYFNNVKKVHEVGGYGSIGWKYKWSAEEANKNILRTHTTAVSAQMLFKIAQDYKETGIFKPVKLFSIDRVFRNESLDKTHLAEFHQIEGVIADRNIGLGHLLGTIEDFFKRMGIKNLRFKPTFNPYTEPSMEVYTYHDILKKYVEIGNSGIFRPEMLAPMGFPEDVQVIAWGLSLERPAMINYGQGDIRLLFGHEVKISDTRKSSVYCLFNGKK